MWQRVALMLLLAVSLAGAKDKFLEPAPIQLKKDGEKWAKKTLKKMTVEEKVGQVIQMVGLIEFYNWNSPEYIALRDKVRAYHLGSVLLTVRVDGPLLLRNQPLEAAMLANQLQRESKLPLLIAADFERGPSMRLQGVTQFPAAMAFGAAGKPELVREFARVAAQESRAMGIHWNYFPVADVNSNPANPIINTRSYGEDPSIVGDLLTAYIQGSRENGMLTTAKHFPGHGDTDTDSHLTLSRVGGDVQRLQSVELPPFRRAIEAGVDSVMVSHVTVPALEPDPNKVASISHAVVNGVLRQQLGFNGLVVTDALDMRALTRLFSERNQGPGRAAVEALKAGNDVLISSADVAATYNGVLEAVRSGEVPENVLDAAALKILQVKASLGLHKARLVDLESVPQIVARPESTELAQRVADSAVTLVRDNGKLLPLKPGGTRTVSGPYTEAVATGSRIVALVLTDDVRLDNGRRFERELRNRAADARVFYVDSRNVVALSPAVLEAVTGAQAVVVAAYAAPSAGRTGGGRGRGSADLPDATAELLRQVLLSAAGKTAIVALGNPYLALGFPEVQTYLCTFSNVVVSEAAAVRALFGEIAIGGRMPVTIPQVATRGTGLDRPAVLSQK